MRMSVRPVEITVFTIIVMIIGALGVIVGILAVSVFAVPTLTNLSAGWLTIPGIIAIIGGVVYLITSYGLWMMMNWARISILILTIPTIVGSFLALFVFPIGTVAGIIGFVFCIITIVYLTGEVKTSFQ
jgi:hypothetical protein